MARLIEHAGDDWTVVIDTSHAPHYVLVTMTGRIGMPALDAYYTSIIRAMNAIMGQGRRFCPVIFDVTEAQPGDLTMPELWRLANPVTPRLSGFVLVNRPDPERRTAKDQFIEAFTTALPRLGVARSQEEALRKLGIAEDA